LTNRLRDIIGVVLVASFIGIIFMLLYKAIPKDNEQLIVYMLGQLSGFVAGVVAFHYVTKAGEKELDEARTANTGKALDAIRAATEAAPPHHAEHVDIQAEEANVNERQP
jgi:hypothetical protein